MDITDCSLHSILKIGSECIIASEQRRAPCIICYYIHIQYFWQYTNPTLEFWYTLDLPKLLTSKCYYSTPQSWHAILQCTTYREVFTWCNFSHIMLELPTCGSKKYISFLCTNVITGQFETESESAIRSIFSNFGRPLMPNEMFVSIDNPSSINND